MAAAAPPQSSGRRRRSDSSLLAQAKIVAIIPLGDVALRVPDLLQQGLYLAALRETLVATTISLVIAGAYRAADWIMTTDRWR